MCLMVPRLHSWPLNLFADGIITRPMYLAVNMREWFPPL